jgi:hypothetical protein
MRRHTSSLWLALAVSVVMALAAPAASADARVGVVVDDVSLGEALLVGAIGSFFGLDTKVVVTYRERQRQSFSQIVLMMYLARLAGCDYHQVAGLRGRGHGWGRMAHGLGIHPGAFNKMRKGFNPASAGDKAFEECALVWFLASYHGASQNDVRRWQGRGHSAPDIFIALDFSSKCGKRPDDLLAHRSKAGSWHSVGTAVGLSGPSLKHPANPRGGSEFRGNSGKSGKPASAGSPSPTAAPGESHQKQGPPAGAKGKGKGNRK